MQEIWSWFAIEVEWAKAILDFLGKIAWPIAVAILLWRWRDVIKKMLEDRDLESLELTLSGLILKRSVTQSLDEAEESLAGEEPLSSETPHGTGHDTPPDSDTRKPTPPPVEKERKSIPKDTEDKEPAHTSPRARPMWHEPESSNTSTVLSEDSLVAAATGRMLIAYKELEKALRHAVEVTGGVPSRNARMTSTMGLMQLAHERGLLPANQLKAFHEVRKIRNELVHLASDKLPLTDAEVIRFVDICDQLIRQLGAAADFWEPPQDDKQ